MKRLYCSSHEIHFQRFRHIPFLFIMLLVACQPVKSTLNPTQPPPTNIPTSEPTSTEPVEVVSPEITEWPTAVPLSQTLSSEYPWLIYKNYFANHEFFVVNQDGTGRATIELPSCDFYSGVDIQENPLNRIIFLDSSLYLVEPSQAKWSLLYSNWPPCHTAFTGNENRGFLANITEESSNSIPKLQIYELPSGKLIDQFPLLKCSDVNKQCNIDGTSWWRMEWSPNGRYLAYPAVLEGPSSDLYVYDTENRNTRRLTSGPDNVGPIWWSPDGSQIIMGEMAEKYPYPLLSSLWSVSMRDNEIRLLYSLDDPSPQGLIDWLDDKRFILYQGTSLYNALDLPATNIRIVDMDSGEVNTLFSRSFVAVAIDKTHETLAVYAYDPEPSDGYEGQGIYLFSVSDPKLRFVGRGQLQPKWNDILELFVTSEPCDDDPEGTLAFNYKGDFQCVYPSSPDNYPSPDGEKKISVENGTWLNTDDELPIQINEGTASQVIWRQDSAGIFFVVNQILYYTSLPEINTNIVDENVGTNQILYQWLDISGE